jgi:hypothetical protein
LNPTFSLKELPRFLGKRLPIRWLIDALAINLVIPGERHPPILLGVMNARVSIKNAVFAPSTSSLIK